MEFLFQTRVSCSINFRAKMWGFFLLKMVDFPIEGVFPIENVRIFLLEM